MLEFDKIEKMMTMATTMTGMEKFDKIKKMMKPLATKKKQICCQKKRATWKQKKRRIPWAFSQCIKLLFKCVSKKRKSLNLGKVTNRILCSKPFVRFKQLSWKY